MKFKKGDTVIYPQHGACIVNGTKKMTIFGETAEYLILKTVINEMTLSVPVGKTDEVGVRMPVQRRRARRPRIRAVEAGSRVCRRTGPGGSRTIRRS